MNKEQLIIANWKSFGSSEIISSFLKNFQNSKNLFLKIIFSPPACYFHLFNNNYILASQEISHNKDSTSSTGQLTCKILHDFNIKYAIIGHFEQRALNTFSIILEKMDYLLKNDIIPIFCISDINEFSTIQEKFLNFQDKTLIIAYEPIESIGTGEVNIETIKEKILFLQEKKINKNLKIIYGGSVNSYNIKKLKNELNVDGFIIGSASQDINSFNNIINLMHE